MQDDLKRTREEMEQLSLEQKEREAARIKEEEEKREKEMELLREQIARDRDEENRQTEAQRNKELQQQLAVSGLDDACVRGCLRALRVKSRLSPGLNSNRCFPLFLCFLLVQPDSACIMQNKTVNRAWSGSTGSFQSSDSSYGIESRGVQERNRIVRISIPTGTATGYQMRRC